jgi:hypothetical protein
MDDVRARIALELGQIDAAETYALNSVRTWGSGDRRDAALAKITLAVTHTLAGESDAPALASMAIDAVSELRSARARADLQPLEQALAARRDSTSAELAHRVRAARRAERAEQVNGTDDS